MTEPLTVAVGTLYVLSSAMMVVAPTCASRQIMYWSYWCRAGGPEPTNPLAKVVDIVASARAGVCLGFGGGADSMAHMAARMRWGRKVGWRALCSGQCHDILYITVTISFHVDPVPTRE